LKIGFSTSIKAENPNRARSNTLFQKRLQKLTFLGALDEKSQNFKFSTREKIVMMKMMKKK